jgi:hypothetical protein
MESPYERPQEGRSGYPEEQPAGVADESQEPQEPSEEKPQRKGGRAEYAATHDEDEGTATGNPHAAGS